MTIRSNIDPVRIGEEILYNIYHQVFHNENIRTYLGFSQINFFCNDQGYPGWNLWFEKDAKTYQLTLAQAQVTQFSSTEVNHPSIIEGRLLIRYFPGEEDPVFDDFSCREILMRLGPQFDATGTPTIAGQKIIDDNDFVVGFLDFRTDTERSFLDISCTAPNVWREVRNKGLYLKNSEGKEYEAVNPGGTDRNIPGWELAFFLFDKIVSGFCRTCKTVPEVVTLAEKAWDRFDIDGDNNRVNTPDSDIRLFCLSLGFDTDSPHRIAETSVQSTEGRLKAQGFQFLLAKDHPEKINPEWWTIKDMNFSEITGSETPHCCYHDH